jgi:acyl carrier protein
MKQRIWETLDRLGLEVPHDTDENLFELGLDSLLLVRLVMSLEKQFSLKLTKNFDRNNFSTLQRIEDHIVSLQGKSV